MKLINEKRAFKMRILENEIPSLIGEKREEAIKVYRKLLSASSHEVVYLNRF